MSWEYHPLSKLFSSHILYFLYFYASWRYKSWTSKSTAQFAIFPFNYNYTYMHFITEQLNQLSIVCIFYLSKALRHIKKYRRAPQRSLLTSEIGVSRLSFLGQMKQQAGSPKVRRRNRCTTPAWQMKFNHSDVAWFIVEYWPRHPFNLMFAITVIEYII